jgi:hypothetical protein
MVGARAAEAVIAPVELRTVAQPWGLMPWKEATFVIATACGETPRMVWQRVQARVAVKR